MPKRILSDEERRTRRLAAKARYRERNREALRVKARDYADRRSREKGIPKLGTPESTANRRRARKLSGAEHGNWKGDDVTYSGLHRWVDSHKVRTGICSDCGDRPIPSGHRRLGTEWANVSGHYKRDVDDYIELCPTCHRRFDGAGLKHGTRTGYTYHDCRCPDCTRSHRDAARDLRRRRKGATR